MVNEEESLPSNDLENGKCERRRLTVAIGHRSLLIFPTAMAFVTISGYPCSGKSTVAQKVKEDLERRLQDPEYKGPALRVVVVSDESLNIPRSAYNGE